MILLKTQKTTNSKGIYKFTDIIKGEYYLKLSLEDIPYKISKITPEPEIFDLNLMKAMFKVNFSKDPETKERMQQQLPSLCHKIKKQRS